MPPCVDCGIDEAAIAVPDALSAIRSFPRRYREALDSTPADALLRRPDADTWSVLEYAVHAREVLELLAMTLPLVLDEPDLQLPEIDATDAESTRPDWVLDRDLAIAGIAQASERLLARGDATPWEAWDRSFRIGTTPHHASWIVQHAAHEGGHHLRDIDRVKQRLGLDRDD